MAMVTVASTCNNGMSQNFAFEDNENHLRVASFSSYLVNGEGTFIPKLNDPAKTTPSTSDQLTMGRKYIEEGELGIFSAEKYFSGRMDEIDMTSVSKNPQKQHPNKEGKIDLPRPKKSFKSSTPSTCSEASWNSRSALLYKDPSSTMQRQMTGGRNFFSSFGCTCVGKKAIVIDEMVGKNTNSTHCKKIFDLREEPIFIHEPAVVGQTQTRTILPGKKQNRVELQMNGTRDDMGNFAFPVLNPAMGNLNSLQQFVEENARPSLEVFGGPHHSINEGMGSNLHRSLTALNSNGAPGPIEDVRASSGAMDGDDDVGSESSSDLFEIESLSNQDHLTFFHPKASDGYGPKPNQDAWIKMAGTTTTTNEARRQPGSLLSCKSAKAVNVVANVHRVPEKFEPGRL